MFKKLSIFFILLGITMPLFAAGLSSELNEKNIPSENRLQPIVSVSLGFANITDAQTHILSVGAEPPVQSIYQPAHSTTQQAMLLQERIRPITLLTGKI